MYGYTCIYIYIYIHIYRERERERCTLTYLYARLVVQRLGGDLLLVVMFVFMLLSVIFARLTEHCRIVCPECAPRSGMTRGW